TGNSPFYTDHPSSKSTRSSAPSPLLVAGSLSESTSPMTPESCFHSTNEVHRLPFPHPWTD
ncbi:hypothetical protein CDAR_439871, partial [Caerostris darwini]